MTHTMEKRLTLLNSEQKDEIEELEGQISNLEARTALTRAAAEKAKASLEKNSKSVRLQRVEAAETLEHLKTKEQDYTNNFDQITEDERKRLEKLIAVEITKYDTLRKESANLTEENDALELIVPELESQLIEERSNSRAELFEENQGVFSTLELVYERANGHVEAETQYNSNMKKTLHLLKKVKPYTALKFSVTESISKDDDFSQNVSDIIEAYLPTHDWSQFDEECNDLKSELSDVRDHLNWCAELDKLHAEGKEINRLLTIDGQRILTRERKMSKTEIDYLDNKIGLKRDVFYQGHGIESDGKYNFHIYECNSEGIRVRAPILVVNEISNPFRHTFRHIKKLETLHMKLFEHGEASPLTEERWNEIKSEEEKNPLAWLFNNEMLYRVHENLDEETYTQLRESYLAMKENESISLSDIENLGYGGNTQ